MKDTRFKSQILSSEQNVSRDSFKTAFNINFYIHFLNKEIQFDNEFLLNWIFSCNLNFKITFSTTINKKILNLI